MSELAPLIANLAGAFALVLLITWPLAKGRLAILMMQLGISAGFLVHYALMGATAAAAMSVVAVAMVLLIAWGESNPLGRRLAGLLLFVFPVVGLVFWHGPESGVAIVAIMLSALGRLGRTEGEMRAYLMAGVVFWLCHDIMIGSHIATAADLLSLALGVHAYYARRRPTPDAATP